MDFSLAGILGEPSPNYVEKQQVIKKPTGIQNYSITPKDRALDFVERSLLSEAGAVEHKMKGEEGTTKWGIRSKYYKPGIIGKPLSELTREDAALYHKKTSFNKAIDMIDSDAIAYRVFDQTIMRPSAIATSIKKSLEQAGIKPPNTKDLAKLAPLLNQVDPKQMYDTLNETLREEFKTFKNYEIYKNGWNKRLDTNPFVVANERTKKSQQQNKINKELEKAFDINSLPITDLLFKQPAVSTSVKIR